MELYTVGNQALAHRYREVAVKTANPMQLIVILYDAAICSLQEAREHIKANNIEGRVRSVNKCISAISELQSSLDLENGGNIASSLDRLYDYMKRRIFTANVQQSAKPLEEIESLLDNLRSAWRAIAEQNREGVQTSKPLDFPESVIVGATAPVAAMPIKSFNISI
jgi:flagellar secretion chaperone FliS